MLCPQCKIAAMYVKNEAGDRRLVYVVEGEEVIPKNPVNASMAQYGVDGGKVNNYLQTPGIKWNTLTDLTITEEGEDYYKDFIGIVSSAITSDEPDPIYRQIIMAIYSYVLSIVGCVDIDSP